MGSQTALASDALFGLLLPLWQVLIGVSGVVGLAITQTLRVRAPEKPVQYRWTER